MFNDSELEDLYVKLDELCHLRSKPTESIEEVKQTLASNKLMTSSNSVKELEQLINDLDNEESEVPEEDEVRHQTKFISKSVAPNGVFSNMKRNVRQSAKIRIQGYANTNAKVVRESSMEPLRLQQYTEK